MFSIVKKGWPGRRMGKLSSRSRVMALRNRRCVLRITSQTNRILRFAHNSVGNTMVTTMRIPPIVGVPAFALCDCGPSSRICCPT